MNFQYFVSDNLISFNVLFWQQNLYSVVSVHSADEQFGGNNVKEELIMSF